MIKEKSCGALVYRIANDQVYLLVLKHVMGGHWAFPKGHVEGSETEKETALREIKEETGLDVELRPGYRKRVFYSPKKGIEKEVVYFLAYSDTAKTQKQEGEIKEIIWVPIEEGHKYLTYRNDRRLLSGAKRYLRRTGELKGKKQEKAQ